MFGFFKRRKHVLLSPEVQLLWIEVEKFRVRYRANGAAMTRQSMQSRPKISGDQFMRYLRN
ncbi:hypothetical protein FHT76_006931 [Rhizobium sp. BK176]|nr:hypothetical protein [Rhizobium sp. BK181]MCS3743529.1 hypothetical protein [Rhizobium sp. BK661]MCS4095221.1 hypothetical protein [Rhizobium sp. BK176]